MLSQRKNIRSAHPSRQRTCDLCERVYPEYGGLIGAYCWMYLGRHESKYWPYWCWAVARSAVLSALLMTGACASLPWGPLCACLRLGRSLTSAASSLDRVVVVAKVLRALRETLLALEARTRAERGLAMACFEAMVAVCGRWWWCRGRGGGMGWYYYRRRRPLHAAVYVAADALVISNAPLGWRRGCCRSSLPSFVLSSFAAAARSHVRMHLTPSLNRV